MSKFRKFNGIRNQVYYHYVGKLGHGKCDNFLELKRELTYNTSKDCDEAEGKILKRIQSMYEQLSIFKLGIKDSKESYESHTKEQTIYMFIVSGAADIPVTRFFGTTPKGLNATGEGDLVMSRIQEIL